MQAKQTPPTMTIRTKPKTTQPIPTTQSFITTETKPTTWDKIFWSKVKKSSKTG